MQLKNKKILVTGGAGFIGSQVVDVLVKKRKVDPQNVRVPRSKELDLRIFENARKAAKGVDVVFHLASDIGGVGYSSRHPASQYYNCSLVDLQVLEAARLEGVKKVVMTSSACAYGHDAPVPLQEDFVYFGMPAKTHDGYGIAKRNTIFLTDLYRRQYGMNVVVVVPNNTYGPRDSFDLEDGHVIPTLIRRCLTQESLSIWGDGLPTRDFFYVEDFAEGMVLAMEKLESSTPVNLGSGTEISVKDLVLLICWLTGFRGEITYDPSKPRGQIKRSVDVRRAEALLGFVAKWSLEEGLAKTIAWYREHLLPVHVGETEKRKKSK